MIRYYVTFCTPGRRVLGSYIEAIDFSHAHYRADDIAKAYHYSILTIVRADAWYLNISK